MITMFSSMGFFPSLGLDEASYQLIGILRLTSCISLN